MIAGCVSRWTHDAAAWLQATVFCWCSSNKVSSTAETRLIEVGVAEASGRRRKHNQIKTSKYTLLWFLPQNLAEQFRRVVNFYFLIVTVIAIFIDSPVSPYTSIAPLSFMVMVTAVKQGYEDWLRHRADNDVNKQIVEIIAAGTVREVRNAEIAAGTLVRVRRGRAVPADLVLLCTAREHDGKCYVTTANLDGETNLKTLRVPPPLLGYTIDMLPAGMRVEVPAPVADLYTFYGRLEVPGRDTQPLSTSNLMLRGSRVRNTEWAVGCAVYTGEETKLALNSKYSSNKFSSCELAVNGFLAFFVALLALEILASYAIKVLFEIREPGHETYLGEGGRWPPSAASVAQDMFSFLLLYYYIIPMSLYVTIEMYKFIGALFIGWDAELACARTGRPAVANTSDLNEDLGQVQVLFCDKTGTLTQNLMVFKACSVSGRVLEERDGVLHDIAAAAGDETPEPAAARADVQLMFRIVATCHSVQISSEEMKRLSARLSLTGDQLSKLLPWRRDHAKRNGGVKTPTGVEQQPDSGVGRIEYQASSPDEAALVEAAARHGVTFLGEEGDTLLLEADGRTDMLERLQTIEFTSERKRMSVVLRGRDGKIWLYCKGAESSVLPLCTNTAMVEATNRDIDMFATRGLRTLAVAYREVPLAEYERLTRGLNRSEGVGGGGEMTAAALQHATGQYRALERDLTLLGATAVEDRLQPGAADTLASLRRAAIRVWLLTGDKVETAINVAQSCAHVSENDERMYLTDMRDEASVSARLRECRALVERAGCRPLTLVVDGTSMALLLRARHAAHFLHVSLRCDAVVCCRLSPIQKAEIVKLVKHSPERPVTAAIGDGANDISMIQEAHVGFGIYGKEGHQAARCADFAFTQFSMVKKVLLVMGHWYYQRLATLILYFFYKNLVFGNLMLFYQYHCGFSTQSIFDSMYLTLFNLLFTSVPCLVLSVTEQIWPPDVLLRNPRHYRSISGNRLMSWRQFAAWCLAAVYHSVLIYVMTLHTYRHLVLSGEDGTTLDLWCYGAVLFHYLVLVVNLKLWLHARYQTAVFVLSVVLSVLLYVAFNTLYSIVDVQLDGWVLGTYTRLLRAPTFWMSHAVLPVAVLLPDYCARLLHDTRRARAARPARAARSTRQHLDTVFVSRL